MILTSDEITKRGIVGNAVEAGKRPTTYDATVGEIISGGTRIDKNSFKLPGRGIVWVVSSEDFSIPGDVTGLATLRTTWTHKGILALNVGIVDPHWTGPLSTALVNFSDRDFHIKKGDQFLRVLFHSHEKFENGTNEPGRELYIDEMEENSRRSTDTFLNMSALSDEVYKSIFRAPHWVAWALYLSIVAFLVAIVAMCFPIAYGVTTEFQSKQSELNRLRSELDSLKAQQATDHQSLDDLTRSKERGNSVTPNQTKKYPAHARS